MRAKPPSRRRSSVYVLTAFSVVAGLLVLSNGGMLHQVRQAQRQSRGIMRNATSSIRLVGRMDHDLGRQRQLIETHIFQKEAVGMAQVEGRLRAVRADYDEAARQYAALAVFPGEASAWQQLKEDVAVIERPVADVLALSRQDRDEEARAAMMALETRFGIIDGDMSVLVRINQDAADTSAARVEALQRTMTVLLGLLAAIGVALITFIGILTTRRVREAEDEARGYAATLEARNRELDEFAGRVAHDLRGPLSAISLAGTILARPETDVAGTVAVLKRGVHRMETLIRDLLALSRVEVDARSGVGDPALVAAQLGEDLAPRLAAERATLRLEVEPAQVRCPEGLLRQVLVNLTDNAIKYRREEAAPEIEICGQTVGNRYELRVADNGIGMSSDEARHAFEPFYRAPGAREAPGTGLGLSIVKRVVEASAGTVTVDSSPGHGTTFLIQLALSR